MRAARRLIRPAASALAVTALAGAGMSASADAAAATPASIGPARIARAVSNAEQSSSLWATVNICDTKRYRNAIGVRGQMPALGFASQLSMVVQVDYWSATARRFVAISSAAASHTLSLGRKSSGLYQDGAVFPFGAHAGLLNATITFTWTRNGTVIGHTRRRTTAGHRSADFGNPAHYSAAQCRIG